MNPFLSCVIGLACIWTASRADPLTEAKPGDNDGFERFVCAVLWLAILGVGLYLLFRGACAP